MSGVAHGDLGQSFRYGTPVAHEIGMRLPRTVELACAAMGVALVFAIPLGRLGALYRGKPHRPRGDDACRCSASRCRTSGSVRSWRWYLPCTLGVLPVAGTGSWLHLVLPAATLGAALAAILARMTRTSLLAELDELYVLAARARGLSRARAVMAHAFRNSLIPVVTIAASSSAWC